MKGFLNLSKVKHFFFIFFPLFLLAVFLLLLSLEIYFSEFINKTILLPNPKSAIASVEYPVLRSEFNPYISAEGAIIMDADSKVVLYAKNPDLRFTLASTTKIMTAITALDYFKLGDILTVKGSSFQGSIVGLKQGEKITFENLLYGMLLPSGNDAAITIADNFNGGEREFVKIMNENAQKWQLINTHYEDTSGLDDGNYTTPLDLARLAAIAIKNPEFAKIVSTKERIISDISGKDVYQLENLNKLLGYDGVNGIKTGYTEEAGQVLVTSEPFYDNRGKHTVVIVVMGSEDRFADTQTLLDQLSGKVSYLTIHP